MNSAPDLPASSDPHLARMLGFVEQDPANLRLIGDTVAVAFDAGAFETATALLTRYEAIAPLPPELVNARGMLALAEGRYGQAADDFSALLAEAEGDAGLRFNLAWARAMVGDHAGALDLLDDATLAASPRAPALKIHMMHHLGLFEDALASGQGLAERFPDDAELMGALSVLALDAEEIALASFYAERAGDQAHEAMATLGTLHLNDYRVDEAVALFDRAIVAAPRSPRAWLGKGFQFTKYT